ncbi:hypothetical protein BH11PLA2_BH11PLA2_29180 [soil metagenome]
MITVQRRSVPRKARSVISPQLPVSKPYRIENAACPRIICEGDVYFNPATRRAYCPSCVARSAVAAMVPAVEGGVR